jgi:hypothetical protein
MVYLIITKSPVMKKINCLSFFLLLYSSISVFAQPDTSGRYFPDRYKLDIPEEWKKPKMIEAISEILPQTFDDYIDSNKQFCLDCKAGLTVMLVIDRPYFNPDKETFQFRAALGLFDTTGKEVIELLLVSPEEKHDVKTIATYKPQPSLPNFIYGKNVITEVIRGPDGRVINVVRIPLSPPPITDNIPVYNKKAVTAFDLMNIAESRVYQTKDILANIKETAAKD